MLKCDVCGDVLPDHKPRCLNHPAYQIPQSLIDDLRDRGPEIDLQNDEDPERWDGLN